MIIEQKLDRDNQPLWSGPVKGYQLKLTDGLFEYKLDFVPI